MRRTIVFITIMLAMCLSISAYTTTAVLHEHNGKIATYEADSIQVAIDDAVDGDVIYLNEGIYPGFTITKKISVKGVGMATVIKDYVVIELPIDPIGGQTLLTEPMLEYLKVNKRISVSQSSNPVKWLKIKQCECEGIWLGGDIYDSYIDRCHISGYYSGIYGDYVGNGLVIGDNANINKLTIVNSRIYTTHGNLSNVTFINCHIVSLHSSPTVKNSIISSTKYYASWPSGARFSYCYIDSGARLESCETISCYERENVEGNNYLEYDSEEIAANGYYGSDGTIVGPLGGNTPYTLVPAIPKVTDGKLSVNPNSQQLNVTLTVSPK